MRQCLKCGRSLPDSEFYYLNNSGTGTCKDCTRKAVRENRKNKIEYYREFDKQRSMLPHRIKAREDYVKNNPDKTRAFKKRWAENNPQKRQTQILFNNRKRNGRIKKEQCLICGNENVQAHHHDYNKPFEIIWLCPKHHAELHKVLNKINYFYHKRMRENNDS